ncbi:MAG: CDP-diacylglycerol--serine O-phosphatidyltransferase [Deltaproteobacteria bacterium]|nr:CDP-diacylglycerol--serine O-phosphatidyltransferase [Deltaproteobacteria bacterium]
MDLRKSKYILPNLFTLASVFFGFVAVVSCLGTPTDAAFRRAAIAILVAGVADSLDGRVARMTRTATKFGIQLDSLADVLSFGMAPAVLGYVWAMGGLPAHAGELIAFAYVSCGALRLARFNVQADHGPSDTFTGLPIPAAASAVALWVWAGTDLDLPHEVRVATMPVVMLATAILMVSTVPYPSFKHVKLPLAGRLVLIAVVAVVIVAAVRTRASAVLLGLALVFITLGPVGWAVRLPSRLRRLRSRRQAAGTEPRSEPAPEDEL